MLAYDHSLASAFNLDATKLRAEPQLTNEESFLKRRLRQVGLSEAAIDAAWPIWWSNAAEASPSARAELRFSLARKLGLDPRTLLDDNEEPRFIWKTEARFKHLSGEGAHELAAITSFGRSIAATLLNATPKEGELGGLGAAPLRKIILKNKPFVHLVDLLGVCWSVGIPVIHLRVFPFTRKRMAAMTVRVNSRHAILLAKDSNFPAAISFYVAHELGHILLGHLEGNAAVVDFDYDELSSPESDAEEAAADAFALELLTGETSPKIVSKSGFYNGVELARIASRSSSQLGIEAGIIALCFGYTSQNWATANAALKRIYPSVGPVWEGINKIAMRQLHLDQIPDDMKFYLQAVLGSLETA
jgi:hypothetical protein